LIYVNHCNRLLSCHRDNAIDGGLSDRIGTTWVGIETANRLNHQINEGVRVVHLRIAPDDPDDELPSFEKRHNGRKLILDSFVSAGGWVCDGNDDKALTKLVAEAFRFIRSQPATKNKVLYVHSHLTRLAQLIADVKAEKEASYTPGSVRPIVVVDQRGFFLDDGDLDIAKIQAFIDGTRPPAKAKYKGMIPEVVLFIVSIGLPSTSPVPQGLVEFAISEEAWRAAFGLREAIENYIPPPDART